MADRRSETSEVELPGSIASGVESTGVAAKADSTELTWLHGVVAVEAIAGGIALILPITPSKTGSDGSMADMFFAEPTYWHEVLVNFVLGNILFAVLILVARIIQKRGERAARTPDAP